MCCWCYIRSWWIPQLVHSGWNFLQAQVQPFMLLPSCLGTWFNILDTWTRLVGASCKMSVLVADATCSRGVGSGAVCVTHNVVAPSTAWWLLWRKKYHTCKLCFWCLLFCFTGWSRKKPVKTPQEIILDRSAQESLMWRYMREMSLLAITRVVDVGVHAGDVASGQHI